MTNQVKAALAQGFPWLRFYSAKTTKPIIIAQFSPNKNRRVSRLAAFCFGLVGCDFGPGEVDEPGDAVGCDIEDSTLDVEAWGQLWG